MNQELKPLVGLYKIQSPCLNLIKGNRPVYNTSKLVKAMMDGEYIPPILVDEETLTIIDGQNRYNAASQLWKQEIPVELHVILQKFINPLLTAIKFNNSSKRWTSENYVEAWIADNRESYIMLKQFVYDCNKLNYKTAVELLYGKSSPSVIPNGTLKICEESILAAQTLYGEILAMADTANCEILFRTGIISSWGRVRKNILSQMTFKEWLKLFKKHFQIPGSNKQEYWINEFYRIQSKKRNKL